MKSIDLYGLGNGIVDVLVEVSEQEFAKLGYDKGTMALLDEAEQKALLESFSDRDRKLVSGGSVANSTVLVAQLGAKTAFSCRLSDDNYGLHYKSEFEGLQVQLPNPLHVGQTSGTSLILITPDAERTMRTSLGISGTFGPEEVEEEVVRQSRWIFIEGYLFCNPDKGQAAINYAIDLAKRHQTKIAVTLSDAWIVNEFRDAVEKAVFAADLVFANEEEAKALARVGSGHDAFNTLKHRLPGVAVTLGGEGCFVQYGGHAGHVPAFPIEPADLTGAGDAFAAGMIYGILTEVEPKHAARGANFLAAQVIQKVGARIHGDAKELWASGLE
ncbi:MAG: adenosine kinase [Bdellovibrionales bacterium]|nr:adenosine kinase [Bdellovibrionales bacterium]